MKPTGETPKTNPARWNVDTGGNRDISVPLLLDDVKRDETFAMSRLVYFSIEAHEAASELWVALREQQVPFLMLGLSGVIIQPMAGTGGFDTADKIDGLFDYIEERDDLVVDTSDIWLPNDLVYRARGKQRPPRGDVYRARWALVRTALAFRAERINESTFLRTVASLEDTLHYSPQETGAFRDWSEAQIREAASNYEKQAERLAYKSERPRRRRR